MTPPVIPPTIGRKVWFYPQQEHLDQFGAVRLDAQPLDATIVYVHNVECVNLSWHDHEGHAFHAQSVYMLQSGGETPDPDEAYCSWMPYQAGQAKMAAEDSASLNQDNSAAMQQVLGETRQPTDAEIAETAAVQYQSGGFSS